MLHRLTRTQPGILLTQTLNRHLGRGRHTKTTTTRRNTRRQRFLTGEIRDDYCNARHKQACGAQPNTYSLRNYNLPVRCTEAQCDSARHHQERAAEDQNPEVAIVEEWTCEDADEDEEEGLYGADEGDGRWGRVVEEGGAVVGLVGAKAIHNAPCQRQRCRFYLIL